MKTKALLIVALFFSCSSFSLDKKLNKNTNQVLECAAKQYRIYLSNLDSCICKKIIHLFITTEARKESLKKIASLDELSLHLRENDWDEEKIENFVMKNIGPFYDDFGRNFEATCTTLFYHPPQCLICLETAANVILSPCGHLPYCQDCLQKLVPESSCPMCRSPVEGYIPLDEVLSTDRCQKCKNTEPNMLFKECMHLHYCEDCQDTFCLVCEKEREKPIKLYLK